MFEFNKRISPFIQKELNRAKTARLIGDVTKEFNYLENAHVLGQESTYYHIKVHYLMLCWGFRQKSVKEIRGQLVRIIGAITKTAMGLVPKGNTGGSNISPFQSLPLDPKHSTILNIAKQRKT